MIECKEILETRREYGNMNDLQKSREETMTDLEETARDIRKKIYQIAHFAGGGHMGASFSMADIISVIYFGGVLKYDASNPQWKEREIGRAHV